MTAAGHDQLSAILAAACSDGNDRGTASLGAPTTLAAEVARYDLVAGRPGRFILVFAADRETRPRLRHHGPALPVHRYERRRRRRAQRPITAEFLPVPGQHPPHRRARPPDPLLHHVTIEDAIAAGKPTVVVISTRLLRQPVLRAHHRQRGRARRPLRPANPVRAPGDLIRLRHPDPQRRGAGLDRPARRRGLSRAVGVRRRARRAHPGALRQRRHRR